MSSYYHNNITGRRVEVMHYLENRSNQELVMHWIDSRITSAWKGPHTAKAGGAYELIAIHTPGNDIYVRPGNMIYITDVGHWFQTTPEDFYANFTPPSQQMFVAKNHTYYSIANPSESVLALYYCDDRGNEAAVVRFLNQFCNPAINYPLAVAEPEKKRIRFEYAPGSTLWIYPDQMAYIRTDTYDASALDTDDFFQYFTKTKPATQKVTPLPETPSNLYVRKNDPTKQVRAAQFTYEDSRSVSTLLSPYGHSKTIPSHGTFKFTPTPGAISIYGSLDAQGLKLDWNHWVVVIERPDSPPMLMVYSDSLFSETFDKVTTLPQKEIPLPNTYTEVTTFDLNSEYGQNRTNVLDALSYLRTSPTDAKFELVTNELMDLLASAFNEGWDEGIDAGQRNPYENRHDA